MTLQWLFDDNNKLIKLLLDDENDKDFLFLFECTFVSTSYVKEYFTF